MATNREYAEGNSLELAPTIAPGATVASGDPVAVGELPGVAVTDGSDTVANDGVATIQMNGVFNLAVKGETGAGSAAITPGTIVYLDTDGELNVDDTNGVRFGYALGPVDSGETGTIPVKIGY